MEFALNNELIPMVNGGKLNLNKIQCLISIKDFIDRISTRNYLNEKTVEEIYSRHKVFPAVITWGDYFQTEIAFDLRDKSDEEFTNAVDTIKFDIMSSYMIFSGKAPSFFDWVDDNYQIIELRKDKVSKEEYEEALHLSILKNYYVNLGVSENFTSEEVKWYNNFKEAIAV